MQRLLAGSYLIVPGENPGGWDREVRGRGRSRLRVAVSRTATMNTRAAKSDGSCRTSGSAEGRARSRVRWPVSRRRATGTTGDPEPGDPPPSGPRWRGVPPDAIVAELQLILDRLQQQHDRAASGSPEVGKDTEARP